MMPFGWHVMIFLVALLFIGVAFKYGQKVGGDAEIELWMKAMNTKSPHTLSQL